MVIICDVQYCKSQADFRMHQTKLIDGRYPGEVRDTFDLCTAHADHAVFLIKNGFKIE